MEIMDIINEIIPLAVKLIFTLIGLGFAKIALPWLKEQRVYFYIQKFVGAAEKLADTGAIPKVDKKSYVIEALSQKGIPLTRETLTLIEAAVEELDCMKDMIISGILEDSKDGEEETEVPEEE